MPKPATGASNSGNNGQSHKPRTKPTRPAKRSPKPTPEATAKKASGRMRIAKAVAQAGLCSRRDAERWIAEGRIRVNGQTIASPALDVGPTDRITVDSKPLPERQAPAMWRYHKPRGLVTTHRDPQGRETVFDNLPDDLPRVISIGRLDVNTEGLLLLTTDGELARHLELPATGWLRRYRVRAHGNISQEQLDALKDGIEIDGIRYGPIEAVLESRKGANCWIAIGLREGKNREVRNVLASLGLTVNRLIRVSYGPFQLLDLKPGTAEPVKRRVLREQLGPTLAKEFNLDAASVLEADRETKPARPHHARQARPDRPRTDPETAPRTGRPTKPKTTSGSEAAASAGSPQSKQRGKTRTPKPYDPSTETQQRSYRGKQPRGRS